MEKLATEEWLTELHLEYIVLQIGSYLEAKLGEGVHQVGGKDVVVDYDDECNPIITTDADYLELYCQMVKDDMEQSREAVQAKMKDRERLTLELMLMKGKDKFIIDAYGDQIAKLSQEIEAATSMPDYMSWWQDVQEELDLLRQRQAALRAITVIEGTSIEVIEGMRV